MSGYRNYERNTHEQCHNTIRFHFWGEKKLRNGVHAAKCQLLLTLPN